MPLETGNVIADLVATNPPGTDPQSQGDDHLRLAKRALLQSFAGFTGAICVAGTDGGAANAYTLTPFTALLAYGARMVIVFSPAATNTGASTMKISGLGAVNLRRIDGTDVVAGDLVTGSIYLALYNGTEFRLASITKNQVEQLAFSATLPSQAGSAKYVLTTNGAVASWTPNLDVGTVRFADSSDVTKRLAFSLSGLATNTTQTIAIPNKSGTMALTSDITTEAALPAQAGNSGKLITTNGTAASWSNQLIANVIRFVESVDPTKQLAFSLTGLPTNTTQTVTIPNKSGVMAMTSDIAPDSLFAQSVYGGRKQIFAANGSFTVPAGVTTIWVSADAGGGGGGGGASNTGTAGSAGGGGGGGAGQSIQRVAYTVTPGQVISNTIGGGGSAGAGGTSGSAGGVGGNGGNTVIGTLVTLQGGSGGAGGFNATGSGAGAPGGSGYPSGAYGDDGTCGAAGGAGASSPFGGGGGRPRGGQGLGFAGTAGYGFGSGGSGGSAAYGPVAAAGAAGGAGAPGFVIIEY